MGRGHAGWWPKLDEPEEMLPSCESEHSELSSKHVLPLGPHPPPSLDIALLTLGHTGQLERLEVVRLGM